MKVHLRRDLVEEVDPNDFRNQGLATFKGWSCRCASSSLYISASGDLYAGICKSRRLGNIFGSEDLQLDDRLGTCPFSACTAIPDIDTDKYSPDATSAIERIESSRQYVALNWDLLKRCNYHCSYCPPMFSDRVSEIPAAKDLILGWENLARQFRDVWPERSIDLYLLGGEPTLVREFPSLVRFLAARPEIGRLWTVTNGSRPVEFLSELLETCNVCVSVHFDHVRPEPIGEKLKSLADRKSATARLLQVKVMVHPSHVAAAIALKAELETNPRIARVELVRLRNIEVEKATFDRAYLNYAENDEILSVPLSD